MSFPTETVHYLTSPSSKLEAKEAAHNRFKYGSPKLRNLLRQQCRVRLKERRNNNFINQRNLLHEERAMMKNIVKDGISQFEQDVILQDLIFSELQDEIEQWLVEETTYLAELDTVEEVICPLCQKRALNQHTNIIFCDLCKFQSDQYPELSKLGDRIQLQVLQHEIKCPKILCFYSEPKSSDALSWIINCICYECDYLAVL